ncbi:phosphate acyltransferase PlsX [Williamwhitmania taraxaci]|uniref:Phosphate acyltransferase n=1 Tax=Williamwhitmania taraxaci TaxID=1640674 RepID=A0A1G6H000_9BACT|nr:phosphate acyltransferase PlsX [Williamwhitmania taraxaci]SDB87531.1 phosphate:acyl-[acyl carrier protein] acyltransferase [Williamwhitmania taraxaci]
MRIGVDAMGGDFAPEATVLGAIQAHREVHSEVRIVLIGNESQIHEILLREGVSSSNFDIVGTTQVINMGDHPTKAFQQKPDSSLAVGFGMLANGDLDGFASAGSTGAMLVGAMYTIKPIPGIIRPGIASFLPISETKTGLLIDSGLNPDASPDVLYQYALLGSIYAKEVFGVTSPTVGLLNIGEEADKGNLVAKSTHQMLKEATSIRFIGNIEANRIFDEDSADVLVCDGFTGNIVLKEAEGFYTLLQRRGISDTFFERFNFEHYGGTPLLGVNAPVIIGHGVSNANAIKNMILQTQKVISAGLVVKIKEALS